MSSIATLKTDIITELTALDIFANIYGYPVSKIESSPIAIVRFTGAPAEFQTNRSNERVDTFEVSIIIPLELGATKLSIEDAVTNMESYIDSVRNRFDDNQNLGGDVMYTRATSVSSVDTAQINNGLNLIASVALELMQTYNVS